LLEVARSSGSDLEQEYRALVSQVVEQRERADRLRTLADQIEENAARDEHLLDELAALLGKDAQLRIEDLDARLRGQRLREVAIEILRREIGPGQPIHYKQWYGLLTSAGYRVAGRDPVATFLAQVHRAEDVERIGARTGRYRLVA
jgi:hypothetical protein